MSFFDWVLLAAVVLNVPLSFLLGRLLLARMSRKEDERIRRQYE